MERIGYEPALTPEEHREDDTAECGSCGDRRDVSDLPAHGSKRLCRENGCLLAAYLDDLEADRARWTGMQLATLREEAMFLVEACDREHERREQAAKVPAVPFNRSAKLSPAASAIGAACRPNATDRIDLVAFAAKVVGFSR